MPLTRGDDLKCLTGKNDGGGGYRSFFFFFSFSISAISKISPWKSLEIGGTDFGKMTAQISR